MSTLVLNSLTRSYNNFKNFYNFYIGYKDNDNYIAVNFFKNKADFAFNNNFQKKENNPNRLLLCEGQPKTTLSPIMRMRILTLTQNKSMVTEMRLKWLLLQHQQLQEEGHPQGIFGEGQPETTCVRYHACVATHYMCCPQLYSPSSKAAATNIHLRYDVSTSLSLTCRLKIHFKSGGR